LYRDLRGKHCAAAGIEIWSWVLMLGCKLINAVAGMCGGAKVCA
jgi:hypothetical protein